MSNDRWTPLRSELDGLNQAGARALLRVRFAGHLRSALQRFVWTPAQVLGVWVFLQVVGRLFTSQALQMGWLPWLIAALVVFVLRVHRRSNHDRERSIARARAIGEWDTQLHLADRLTAADDFLHQGHRTAFMEAAVEDAAQAIEGTRKARLEFEAQPWQASKVAMPVAAVALLLITGSLVGRWQSSAPESVFEAAAPEPGVALPVEALPDSEPQPHEAQEYQNEGDKQAPSTDRPAVSETQAYATEVEEKSKESAGKTGNGRSAAAESSTGAGNSQGTPSQQGQISKPGKEKTKAKAKQSKQKPHKQQDKPAKNEEQESGSTAGRGSSRGSNRNPASSDWSSKDHVNTPDDSDLAEEEETDDEEEEQEARGGMQPSLRDRRPPVSRELLIGFGNQPNPDANGRGGPSQPKKSRGTASLVLGVPIPDRVKGQPNPGKTKITQERVQPKAEPAAAVNAEQRPARVAPGSALQRQQLAPSMRKLLRDYFLTLRKKVQKP